MAAPTTSVAAITNMVRGSMEAVPLDAIVGQPTLHSMQHLIEHLAKYASHLATTRLGGKYGSPPLVLSKAHMRPAAGKNNLDCEQLKKTELTNPRIDDRTQGRELLQLQAEQKIERQEYTFQEVVESVAVEAIVVAADAQYVEELKEYYAAYKKQTIKTLVTKLSTWYVINTKDNLAIKAHFLAPWSNTQEAHVTTFAHQMDRRQVECEGNGVIVTNDDKVDHFVAQMYAWPV